MSDTKKTPAKKAVPEGVKKPQDHKASEPEVLKAKIRGVNVEIKPELFDDFELMSDIARVEDGDITRAAIVLRRLVPDEVTRSELMESARDKKTGRIPLEAGATLVFDVFNGLDPNS